MTHLSLPQKPSFRIGNRSPKPTAGGGAAGTPGSPNPPASSAAPPSDGNGKLPPEVQRKLDAILRTGEYSAEETAEITAMLLRMHYKKHGPRNQPGLPAPQPSIAMPVSDRTPVKDIEPPASVGQDHITVQGNVLPGGGVGGSTIYNSGGVAGRDHLTVSDGATHITIEKAEQVVLPGIDPKALDAASNEIGPISDGEREYLTRLLVTANRVPLGQLDFETATGEMPEIKLDAIYIPLETTATEPAIGGRGDERVNVPALKHAIEHRRVVILGDPGSGKSTFLNYLTWCLAGARLYPKRGALERLNVEHGDGRRAARWRHGALLPIRVDLREFALDIPEKASKGSAGMLWKHITRQLEEHHQDEFAREMQAMLNDGKALVMLDGLDEVADRNKRQIVRQAIADFADSHSHSRFIVTCRILSYTDPAWRLTSFPDVTLAPLSRAAIGVFVEGWYTTLYRQGQLPMAVKEQRSEELRHAASGSMYDLAQNPMLLTVMALVHTYRGTLPRERARLYWDCVGLLLWNWQRTKQIGPEQWESGIMDELNTREERVMNALYEVAYNAHKAQLNAPGEGVASIPQKELLDTLQKYLDNDWGKAQKFCEYVETRAGLLIGRGEIGSGHPREAGHRPDQTIPGSAGQPREAGHRPDQTIPGPAGQPREAGRNPEQSVPGIAGPTYAFPHRGFQEFLAGCYLVNGREFGREAAKLALDGDNTWHEPLLLAAGHLVYNLHDVLRPLDAANLMCGDELPADEAGWRAVWWAAEILLIVGRSAAEQDSYVGQKLAPRVVAYLTRLLEDDWLAPAERAQAADALGCLGDPRPGVCTLTPLMARIEGGTFSMGEDDARHAVRIAPFLLARYPVTNAQFRLFAEKDYNDNAYWTPQGIEWRDKAAHHQGLIGDPAWGIDNRPAVGLTWHEAVAYTRWLGKKTGKPFRLPSEAEWERAAAGSEGRRYPWGSRTSDDTANIREAGIGQTTAVGIFGADKTPEGINDLGGNVWEWTNSLDREYPYKAGDGREALDAAGQRILRGGAYDTPRRLAHGAQRRPAEPSTRAALIGFRVAMDA